MALGLGDVADFQNAAGNFTIWTGVRIKFTKPTKEINPNDE